MLNKVFYFVAAMEKWSVTVLVCLILLRFGNGQTTKNTLDIILDIFSNTNTSDVLDKSPVITNDDCECISYNLCTANNDIITNGLGVINIRYSLYTYISE